VLKQGFRNAGSDGIWNPQAGGLRGAWRPSRQGASYLIRLSTVQRPGLVAARGATKSAL
jgi:hypothetical protein